MMSYEEILYQAEGPVRMITLNRPEALNALTETMRRELGEALAAADADASCRVVLLKGAGRAFCVGQDLKEMLAYYEAHGPELGRLVDEEYIPLVHALRNLSKPTVALLEGAAVGGGMALALATDFRVITGRAQLTPAFVNVALAPDTGTAFLLARAVGHARAISLSMLGTPLKAHDMVKFGLADAVYESAEEARTACDMLLQQLGQGPTETYRTIRQLFDETASLPLEDVLRKERDAQDKLAHTRDHSEAVEAFLAKRAPNFEGK